MTSVPVPFDSGRPRALDQAARLPTVVHEAAPGDLDLHELVIERMFAAGLQLSEALDVLADDPQQAAAQISAAVEQLEVTIGHVRVRAFGLLHTSTS